MNQKELLIVLEKHGKWLENEEGGERANLRDAVLCGADLRGADLRDADLRDADLCDANLCDANLRDANLCGADLRDADLCDANLRDANLCGADLRDADLCYANLRDANLCGADLCDANLRDADLCYANLRDANLCGAILDYANWPLWCGSLRARIDDCQAKQLLYHVLSAVSYSDNCSGELKAALLTETNITVANQFHRVDECGELKIYEEGDCHGSDQN